MFNNLSKIFLMLLLIGFSIVNDLHGQAVNGTLLGTIKDTSDSVIGGVTVTITEVNTGIKRSATTNDEGYYVFSNLPPGLYSLEAEKTSFKKALQNQINVTINSSVRADIALEPGGVNEQVIVNSTTPLLQTDRSDLGQKITGRQVSELPLSFNRNFQSLLNLVPGTTRAYRPHSEFFNSQDSLSTRVNGQSRLANNVQIEGIDNNHRSGLLTVLIPPIEAIQTVDVTTSNYEAELGRVGGAVTNVELRSGTNDLHGSAFWFNRVNRLEARNYFSSSKAPHSVYNLFGFTLGGPIIKNKLFYFGDYQGIRDRRGQTLQYRIPSTAFRNGDLRGGTTVYDPNTGNPLTGVGRVPISCNGIQNVICSDRISPVARRILALLPEPNIAGAGFDQPNYEKSTVRLKDTNSFDVKITSQLNQMNNLSVRYSYMRPKVLDPGLYGIYGGPKNDAFAGTGISTTQSGGANFTHIFTTKLLTELRFGFSRYRNDALPEGTGLTTSTDVGIPGANIDDWSSGISAIRVNGFGQAGFNANQNTPTLIGFSPSLPWIRAETNFNLVNNWTRIFGNHTLKWGADVRRLREDLLQTQTFNPRGIFRFNEGPTTLVFPDPRDPTRLVRSSSGVANSFASFLLDAPSAAGRDLPINFPALRQTFFFSYIQDKWQVTPKLTIDIGLRHELYRSPRPRFPGGFSNYDVATNSLLLAGIGEVPMNLGINTDKANFNPRFGIAYRLNSKTVFRGGYGISTVPFPDNQYAFNYPVVQNYFASAPGGESGSSFITGNNFGRLSTGFPTFQPAVIPETGIIPVNTSLLINQAFNVIPRDLKEGYVQSWNVAVQRSLPWQFTFEAAYIGNRGVGILYRKDLNASTRPGGGNAARPFNIPQYGNRTATLNTWVPLSSNYNALQLKFDRRFASSFLLTTAYTYSKAIDYATDNGNLFDQIRIDANRARAEFDRTHNFVQSYVVDLPFGKGRRWVSEGLASHILGGWQLNGIFTAATGIPLNLTVNNATLNAPPSNNRPNINGPLTILKGVGTGTQWFDKGVFSAPAQNTFGNVGRNIFNGPGFVNFDLSVMRKIRFTEDKELEFRMEAFNVTNTPHFDNPDSNFNSRTFGQVISAQQDQRQIQLGMKFKF